MERVVLSVGSLPPEPSSLEVVERKGVGHPDTLCDSIAEALSRALCGWYIDHAGAVLHHNVDKVLLVGGAARPAFRGGTVDQPVAVYVAGRATGEAGGHTAPIADLVHAACEEVFARDVPELDRARHLSVTSLVRAGSGDLVDLFARGGCANDTSCGVGRAPLTALEEAVHATSTMLADPSIRATRPWLGTDTKVMGVDRRGERRLTVSAALVGRHLLDLDDYLARRDEILFLVRGAGDGAGVTLAEVVVNAADAPERGSVFLTVTGTSAEAGDDGEVGRGNRLNGLITPCRPMSLEAAAGKNPRTHVGKIYNAAAEAIAADIVRQLPVAEARCTLVSRIGWPVRTPWAAELRLRPNRGVALARVTDAARDIADVHLAGLDTFWLRWLSRA